MTVRVILPPKRPASLGRLLRRAAATAYRTENGPRGGEINLIFRTPAQIRALNKKFRRVNRDTDVIAFRYENSLAGGNGPFPFGDLFICEAVAARNAKLFGVSLREELARLAVHGTLHLFGYTDYEPRPKDIMWRRQEGILRRVLRG